MSSGIFFLLILTGLFCFSLGTSITGRSLYLLSHKWCRKCDKTIQIMQKILTNFGKIYSQEQMLTVNFLHSEDDFHDDTQNVDSEVIAQMGSDKASQNFKQIYAKIQQKQGLSPQQIPFPTIWLECPSFSGFYQNELSYLQLEYWINFHCYSKLPVCRSDSKSPQKYKRLATHDYQFTLSLSVFEKNRQNVDFFQSHFPFAKLCLEEKDDSGKNLKSSIFLPNYSFDKAHEFQKSSLFFSSFNHNIRNYLFNPGNDENFRKLGIFLIFNSPSHPKVRQFIEIFKFISDKLKGDNQIHINQGKISTIFGFNSSHKEEIQSRYHQSSIKSYDIKGKQHIFQNLAFVGTCYNEDRRDCIMKYQYSVDQDKGREKDPSQKPNITQYIIPYSFVGTKTQTRNIQRLMEFANVRNKFQSDSDETIAKNHGVQILAFHFDRKSRTIKGYEFDDIELSLGNSFLFWIQSIYSHVFADQMDKKPQQRAQNECLSSELTHAISQRNLTTIKQNIKLQEIIEKVNSSKDPKDKIKLITIVAETEPEKMKSILMQGTQQWKSEYFKFCIKDQSAKHPSYDEIVDQLAKLIDGGKQMKKDLKNSIENSQQL